MNYQKILKDNNFLTPCFLIDEDEIGRLSDEIAVSLKKRWKNGIVGYSFKTNNLPWLISFYKKRGFYAEVVSADEFALALELGYSCDNIIFNGPAKEEQAFKYAVNNGAVVNVDSKRELQWLKECGEKTKKARIGIRVNFCLESYCPGESQCGLEDGRFGFSYENGELKRAIEFLRENKIKIDGLHLHCSSKTRSLNIYKAISTVASEIIDTYRLEISYVDIGGGFFGGLPEKPSFDEYFDVVYAILGKYKTLNIIIEPGMSVVGAGVDYITSVVDEKMTLHNRFALLDGSRIHIDPIKRKKTYSYEIIKMSDVEVSHSEEETILCGFTCMEDDRFFSLFDIRPHIGDKVIFKRVGAYTMGLSPQFIEFYPRVYCIAKNNVSLVRDKVTAKQFVSLNQKPEETKL